MAQQFHVNGTSAIATGTGSAQALEDLGISVDGVHVAITTYTDPVIWDTYGPHVAGEYQYFGQDAIITIDLVYWDKAVLAKWLSGTPGAGGTEGTLSAAGKLYYSNSLSARLLIKSTPTSTGLTTVEDCHNFPYAFLIDASEVSLGTRRSSWKLRFKATITGGQPTGMSGAVLYNTVCV